ncbi:TetR family transcriptional regulator [Caulobacter sp. B11]|uniref:TetR/AcrR family transcriptional regulator n=1 Tax=Caulobacter sp. B11 TaxID=2048899 RepID=UPI000C12C009|nr:TetR/AcrR family transcriptional regulator [Caulobacter sp. B11]PHY13407.1 TetR family transcriptional regulator [Caulobacter sp. B11]
MLMGTGLKRSERKKGEILAAARHVFLREGYAEGGMEVVARAAGVSTATLYAYFPSKAELFAVVVHALLQDMTAPVLDAAALPGDAQERLTRIVKAYAAFAARPATRASFRMVIAERRRFPELADRFLLTARGEMGGAVIATIEDLGRRGALRFDKAAWAAGQLLGMIDHATLMLGLAAGDHVQAQRPLDSLCDDAIETFLSRYGVDEPVGCAERALGE